MSLFAAVPPSLRGLRSILKHLVEDRAAHEPAGEAVAQWCARENVYVPPTQRCDDAAALVLRCLVRRVRDLREMEQPRPACGG
jgi:hypothetical protein